MAIIGCVIKMHAYAYVYVYVIVVMDVSPYNLKLRHFNVAQYQTSRMQIEWLGISTFIDNNHSRNME
jgi:hypothetical protein